MTRVWLKSITFGAGLLLPLCAARAQDGRRISSSFLANLTLSTRFKRSGWLLSASSYNLFDRTWATPTGPEVLTPATIQNGRTVRFTISYKKRLEADRSTP